MNLGLDPHDNSQPKPIKLQIQRHEIIASTKKSKPIMASTKANIIQHPRILRRSPKQPTRRRSSTDAQRHAPTARPRSATTSTPMPRKRRSTLGREEGRCERPRPGLRWKRPGTFGHRVDPTRRVGRVLFKGSDLLRCSPMRWFRPLHAGSASNSNPTFKTKTCHLGGPFTNRMGNQVEPSPKFSSHHANPLDS